VLRIVDRIVDEKTGRMLKLPNRCVILDGVTCGGCLSSRRLFCPRGIFPYWHEVWLTRVVAPAAAMAGNHEDSAAISSSSPELVRCGPE